MDNSVSAELEDKLLDAAAQDKLLVTLNDLQRNSNNTDLLDEALCKLHNAKDINIINVFGTLTNHHQLYDFFQMRHIFEKVLPKINDNINIENIMSCVIHLIKQAEEDGFATIPLRSFQQYCQADVSRLIKAIDVINNTGDTYSIFVKPILLTLSENNLNDVLDCSIKFLSNEHIECRAGAIEALGMMNYSGKKDLLESVFEDLKDISNIERDSQIVGVILKSLLRLCMQHKILFGQYSAIWNNIENKTDKFILHAVAELICEYTHDIPDEILIAFIDCLSSLDINNKGTLRVIFDAIANFAGLGKDEIVFVLLKRLLMNESGILGMDVFFKFSETFDAKRINSLLNEWLLLGEPILYRAIKKIIIVFNGEPELAVDVKRHSDLSSEIYIFMAHKVVGWLYEKPISVTSFLISLLRIQPENNEINNLLYYPMLFSYQGKVKTYIVKALSDCADDDKLKPLLENILGRLTEYEMTTKLDNPIIELQPLERQRYAFDQLLSHAVVKEFKKHSKQLIFYNLAKKVTALYGRKVVGYHEHPSGHSDRYEMPMDASQHVSEWGVLDSLDPVNLQKMLFSFKVEELNQ